MDSTLLWAFGAAWAGVAWSIVTWLVAEVRGDDAGKKKYGAALAACLVLSGVLVVVMLFVPTTDAGQDVAAVGGIVTGSVLGVFTGFGVMGGKPPTGPPG